MYYTWPHRHTKHHPDEAGFAFSTKIYKGTEVRGDEGHKLINTSSNPGLVVLVFLSAILAPRFEMSGGDEQTWLHAPATCAGFSPASNFVLRPPIMDHFWFKENQKNIS